MAQETLLKVFENFDHLREPERVRPWVFQIAKNACLMKRRKSVFAPSRELSLDEFLPAMDHDGGHSKLQIADWSRLPDKQFLQAEMKQVLDQAIRELPETYRPVILLRDVEELSTIETAQILDLTEDVVKMRLHRARLAVRQRLMNTCVPMAGFCQVTREQGEMELHERTDKCKEVFSLLSQYLNLELPPDACQEIKKHLAGCPPCVEFTESLRKTVELCRSYGPTELPEPLGKNARQQILDAYKRMLDARNSTFS